MVAESFTFPDGKVIEFAKMGMVGEVARTRRNGQGTFYYFNVYVLGGVGPLHVRYTTEFETKAVREVLCSQLADYLDEHPVDEYSIDE